MILVKIGIVGTEQIIYNREFKNMSQAKQDISNQIPQVKDLEIGEQKIEQYQIIVTDTDNHSNGKTAETTTEIPTEKTTTTTTKKTTKTKVS